MFEHFKSEGHSGFLGNAFITLIDKIDSKDPKRRENYWMKTLKTYAPFGLNIEDSFWPNPSRSINVTDQFTCLVLFGMLVRLGTDLGQDFLDMAYIFLYFLYCLFPYYQFVILCNLFLSYELRVTFILYVSIVSIAWCNSLYCLLIYCSYLYHC